ncbi:hypothetical protein Tco_0777894 [Tanacetum coccineum]
MANQEQNPPQQEQPFVAAKQVSFNLEDIILNTNNEVALLYPEHTNKDFFKYVSDFISKCCIRKPFTRSPNRWYFKALKTALPMLSSVFTMHKARSSPEHKKHSKSLKTTSIAHKEQINSSLPTKLKDLPSKFNELTREVKGLKKQVHELENINGRNIHLTKEEINHQKKLEEDAKAEAHNRTKKGGKGESLERLGSIFTSVYAAVQKLKKCLRKELQFSLVDNSKSLNVCLISLKQKLKRVVSLLEDLQGGKKRLLYVKRIKQSPWEMLLLKLV